MNQFMLLLTFAALYMTSCVSSAGDRRCHALSEIVEAAIMKAEISPDDLLDDLEAKLDPVLDPFEDSPTYGKVIAGVLETSFGISNSNIRGYMMRRQRKRVREWKTMVANGEAETRRLQYGKPCESEEARRRRTIKRRGRAEAAKEAEMDLLFKKMKKLRLNFEMAPIEFVYHHDALIGKHTENQYARILNALRRAFEVSDDWLHKYKILMKRRRRMISKGEDLNILWMLRKQEHIESTASDDQHDDSEGQQDGDDQDSGQYERMTPLERDSKVSSRLSRPLHDF